MTKKRELPLLIVLCTAVISFCLMMTPTFSAAEVIKLTISDHNPPFTPPGKAMAAWVAEVNERAKGKLQMTLHGGGALLSATEGYRGVQSGVVDGCLYVVDTREDFILNLITGLPFMGWPDRWVAEEMYQQMLDKSEAMRAEWEGVTIISFMMMPGTLLHMAKKPVILPDDLKGQKIMGAETMLNAVMKAAGATPVHMDIGDMAPSLNTGLIQGIMNHINVVKVFGALEHVPYHTYFGEGITFTPVYVVMNSKKLDSLPPDLKKIILDSGQVFHDSFKQMEIGFHKVCMEEAKKMNHTFTYLTPGQIAVWYDLVKAPIHDKWIKDAEAKGRPGKEVYKMAMDLIENYKK